ncbi:hypothetical protein [Mycetocola zhujimingii]|uniref:hypothetical protein n=1 Tax=Mycetocola zhujimingii TaxID=2079792 RepID=UPI0013C460C2|nr:hypothetical protein [Mycetocola zhujimingii]
MRTHRLGLLLLASVLCVAVAGCGWIGGWGGVCPAIGYISEVRVVLVGDAGSVDEVRLCDEVGVCSAVEAEVLIGEDEPLTLMGPDQLSEQPTPVEIQPEEEMLDSVPFEVNSGNVVPGPTLEPAPESPGATPGATPSGAPVEIPPYLARSESENVWVITMMAGRPDEVTVTAYRLDGSVAGESSSVALEWKRVGGSEQCGGPTETDPVTVVVR